MDDDVCATLESEGVIEPDNQMHSVFEWDDPVSNMKKVTVVMTLPSGTKNVRVMVGTGEGTGVTSEVIVKYPWSEEYMDPNLIFKTRDNKHTKYYLEPEAVAFANAIKASKKNVVNIPNVIYRILLPIPVQTTQESYTTNINVFTPYKDSVTSSAGKNDQKQRVLLIRIT